MAILVAHVFYNTTIVIRLVGGALSRLDPRLSQSARTLGAAPWRVSFHVVLPLLRPSLLAAALLVFLFDFTSFGVILLLGGPAFSTLEVQIYTQALQLLNLPAGSPALSDPASVHDCLFGALLAICTSDVCPVDVRAQRGPTRARWSPRVRAAFVGLMLLVLTLLFILPMLALPFRSVTRLEPDRGQRTAFSLGLTSAYYAELFVNRQDSIFYVPPARAAVNSLIYASATVVLALLMGFPAAYALAHPGRLERILDPVLLLPLGVSAVTLGLGFILAFGRWLAAPWLVPLAHTLVALPFVIRALQPALATLPRRLRASRRHPGSFTVAFMDCRRLADLAPRDAFRRWLRLHHLTWRIWSHHSARPTGVSDDSSCHLPIPFAAWRPKLWSGNGNGNSLMVLTTVGILFIERLRMPGTTEF